MCVFSCISLHLGEAFCIVSHCDLFLCSCCCCCCCSFPAKLSASCHVVTCFFVDVVDFSLMTTLFCFISFDTLLATFLCLY